MDEPPDNLVEQALQHQLNARAYPVKPSSAFLLTTKHEHSDFAKTTPPSKKRTVKAVEELAGDPRTRYPWERWRQERSLVFQLPNRPTTAMYEDLQKAAGGVPPLPGGVPLIDHLLARVLVSRDYHDLGPRIEELRRGRPPTQEDTTHTIELTLGVSTPDQRTAASAKLDQIKKADTLHSLMAADVEASPIAVTWEKQRNESTFDALMTNLTLDTLTENDKAEFTIAGSGHTACSLPTRFFCGSLGHPTSTSDYRQPPTGLKLAQSSSSTCPQQFVTKPISSSETSPPWWVWASWTTM